MPDYKKAGAVHRSGTCTLDATGSGTIIFEVQHANQRWKIYSVVISTNQAQTTAPYPQATVYAGGIAQPGLSQGASWLGNQVTLTGEVMMDPGIDLTVGFSGGVPGTVATAVIDGDNELWR